MSPNLIERVLGLVFHLLPLLPLCYIVTLPVILFVWGDGQIWLFLLSGLFSIIIAWLGHSVPQVLFFAGVVISEFPGHFLLGQFLLVMLQMCLHYDDTLLTLMGAFSLLVNILPLLAFFYFATNQYLARYQLRLGLDRLTVEEKEQGGYNKEKKSRTRTKRGSGRHLQRPIFEVLALRNWWKPVLPICSVYLPKLLGGTHKAVGVVFASVSSLPSSPSPSSLDDVDLECDIHSQDAFHNERSLPVVIYIHGGAWTVGRKDLGISFPLVHEIVTHGWLCVSIDYRLCDRGDGHSVDMLTQIVDCKRAIHWVKENIGKYGGDPNCIVCMGESAGGHLAVIMALTQNIALYQPGFEDADTSILGCIDLFGVHDLLDTQGIWGAPTKGCAKGDNNEHHSSLVKWLEDKVIKRSFKDEREVWNTVSPYQILKLLPENHLVPPIFGIHGEKDSVVPVEDSDLFYDALYRYRLECDRRNTTENEEKETESRNEKEKENESEEEEEENNKKGKEKEIESEEDTIKLVSTKRGLSHSKVLKSRRLRVRDAYVKLPGAHHGFTSWSSVRCLAVADASVAFLAALAEAHQDSLL